MKLYRLKDKVTEKWIDMKPYPLIGAENKADAVRRIVPDLLREGWNFNDLELWEIGDLQTDGILNEKNKMVEWTEYKYPETKADLMRPLGLSEEMIDKMQKQELK